MIKNTRRREHKKRCVFDLKCNNYTENKDFLILQKFPNDFISLTIFFGKIYKCFC
jgi:hypothetical protein